MDIKEYAEKVRDKIVTLRDDLDPDFVTKHTVNDNEELLGIRFAKKNDDNMNMPIPCIYVNYYYNNDIDIDEAVKDILNTYEMSGKETAKVLGSFSINDIEDYDLIQNKIFMKLINKSKNEPLLNDTIYKEFGDLVLVPYILVDGEDDYTSYIRIPKRLVGQWGKEEEEILENAYYNTFDLYPCYMEPMVNVMNKMLEKLNVDDEIKELMQEDSIMYMCSNNALMNGAFYLTSKDALNKLCNKIGSSIISIIPSSRHEIIAVPYIENEINDTLGFVTEVNCKELMPEDVLTDNLYKYNSETETLTDAENNVIKFPF